MRQTRMLARELGVVGLINVQFAIFEGEIYILEVNPRASRTIPFVSKAIGVPLAKLAARVMAGKKLAELGFTAERMPDHVSVKESVFPFVRFPGVDTHPGPRDEIDRRSDGHRSDVRDGVRQGRAGRLDRSARQRAGVHQRARRRQGSCWNRLRADLSAMGFELVATGGTARHIEGLGIACAIGQQGRAGQSARRRSDARGQDRDGDQHARRVGHQPTRFRFGARRWSCGCRSSPRWRARRPRSRQSRRLRAAASKFARSRTTTRTIAPANGSMSGRRKTAAHNLSPRSGASTSRIRTRCRLRCKLR